MFLGILGYYCVLPGFTTGYVRLVGQEPAPSKCVLMSTSRAVRGDMRGWIVTDEDVRDLGEVYLDTTFRG